MKKFKLRHNGCGVDCPIQSVSRNDHPILDSGYVRKWKNHVSFYFADMMSDGAKNRKYKPIVKEYVKYLKELGLNFTVTEKVHKGQKYNYTLIKLGLNQVKIIK